MTQAEEKLTQSKRVLAIHDLSGYSHTSLMAVIPIMNVMGIAVTALPTAVLSSNTEHKGFQMLEMTDSLEAFLSHWNKLNLKFSAIYSGFLSSEHQVKIVLKAIELYKKGKTLVIVDPVMADDGRLYDSFSQSIIECMQRLIPFADVITPNLTEAAFLLNEKYDPFPDIKLVKNWCLRLAQFGPRQVVITNVPVKKHKDKTSVICYDKTTDRFQRAICKYLPVNYPGTGDIFTSVLTGLLLKGIDIFPAVEKTVKFVSKAIQVTMQNDAPPKEGICLEKVMSLLLKL